MESPPVPPLPISETDDFNSMEFPPLDNAFLNNTTDLGFMDDLAFNGDFDLDFFLDDVIPSDGSENGHNSASEWFNDAPTDSDKFDSRVLDSGDQSSNSVSRVLELDSPEMNSGNYDEQKVDPSFNDVDRVLISSSDSGICEAAESVPVPSSSQDSGGSTSAVGEFLNSPSPESGVVSDSTFPSPVLKRKKEKEDEVENQNENCNNSSLRGSKLRKSNIADSVAPEEDKKKVRLMRNRESAQLSRQRKKHYVEELEDKVRSMHTVIADLNSKVSYFMAENASLRQQLTSGSVPPPAQPGVYPPPTMVPQPGVYPPHMAYPWIPYPMKPQGSQLPLVPIPRLKPRQPVSAPKVKKSESKKSESKTKKVSSVTFLGLLFFVFLFWGLVPLVNVKFGDKMEMGSNGFGYSSECVKDIHQGRILTVNSNLSGSHHGVEVGYRSGKSNLRECGANRRNCRRIWVEGAESNGSQPSPSSNNSSEPLVASLYVPRNDKLVKIDGNLIIHSVLASEKAMASRRDSEMRDKATRSSTNESPQTSLAVPGNLGPALSVPGGGMHSHMYRSPNVRPKALNPGSRDSYREGTRSSTTDGSLQKWFREGLAGPILSSGMCTEVFQFDISGSIVPATSTMNASSPKNTSEEEEATSHSNKRNRRFLNHLPVPFELNETEQQPRTPSSSHSNKNSSVPSSSMVVSVLADPRDIEVDGGGISPKSLSRIFVVVLIDSVKYVTYSCMLPFKGATTSHLVTA